MTTGFFITYAIKILFILMVQVLKSKQKKKNTLVRPSASSHRIHLKIQTKNFHLELTIL